MAKVFVVKYEYEADLLFYEVDYESEAKWRTSHKWRNRLG